MARGSRTVYLGERNKALSSTFQPPEEGRSVQRPKRCDKHGDKDEDNSLKNVNKLETICKHHKPTTTPKKTVYKKKIKSKIINFQHTNWIKIKLTY